MICDLKPYPEMKGTSIPWLGELPAGWSVCRNGSLFVQKNEKGFADLPILEVSLKTGVRVREFGGSSRKQIMEDRAKYKRASCGDLAYNMMRMWQGAVGVAPVDGLVSPAYVVARPLPGVLPHYFAYLFRTDAYMGEVDNYSRGIVKDRNRLYWEQFKKIQTPSPPTAEQAAIVRFLDHADHKIRRYIHAKQKLIKLLEEQKQAIIHRAIIRGLDPNVRFKPSGVEWLGDVPEHWEVKTLGQVASSFRTGPFGSALHQSEYVEGGIPIVNPTHIREGRILPEGKCSLPPTVVQRLSSYSLEVNDVIFSRRGDLGRCALVRNQEAGWICGTGSMRVRIDYAHLEPEYLIQVLQMRWVGEYLSLYSVGATMDSLNTGILKDVPILLPPLDEQSAIVEATWSSMDIHSKAVFRAKKEIVLLREYHTRLIADVVIGKLDVREAATQLPDDVELQQLDELDDVDDTEEAALEDLDEAPEDDEA